MSSLNNPNLKFRLQFLCPKFWGIWFGYFLLRLIGFLPYKQKLSFGRNLGTLLFQLAKSRRELARRNLKIAFPEKADTEINQLLKSHFQSIGIGIIEITITAWGKHRYTENHNEKDYFRYFGLENLEQNKEHGILLLLPHFTTMEMTGLLLSFITDFRPIYRKHDNLLLEYLITKSRTPRKDHLQKSPKPLLNTDTKTMLKALRAHEILWIAPDQKFTSHGSINVPFFGVDAPSNPGINKLAKLGKAKVVPCFTRRVGDFYELHIHPALENYPSGDDYADILRLHHLYETEIRQNPSQYLWVHDRWDTRHRNPLIVNSQTREQQNKS